MYGSSHHLNVDTSSTTKKNNGDASTSSSAAASPYWQKPGREEAPTEGFSPVVAFCFTINYILGTGFLTVPWAFQQGGLLFSALTLMAVGILSDVSKDFLLETLARAEAMLDQRMHWIKRKTEQERLVYSPVVYNGSNNGSAAVTPAATEKDRLLQQRDHDYDENDDDEEAAASTSIPMGTLKDTQKAALLHASVSATSLHSMPGKFNNPNVFGLPTASEPTSPTSTTISYPTKSKNALIGRRLLMRNKQQQLALLKNRKFEVNLLCRVFLGKSVVQVYTACIALYIYCTLWAYTSVFGSALAQVAPVMAETEYNYVLYVCIFALMVVPLSCMELNEQVPVQVCMTLCRFIMLACMLSTCDLLATDLEASPASRELPTITTDDWIFFRPKGIPQMLPICVFAHIFHHSIPGLSHPVGDKRQVGRVFTATIIFSTTAYTILGVAVGLTVGRVHPIEQSSNLAWHAFHAGTGTWMDDGSGYLPYLTHVAWWAKLVSIYIVCFPALDVVSAFPLNAITLGNNMLGAFFGRNVHEAEQNRWIRIQFRLLASIPPILLAVAVRELGTITDYAGTTGFIIGFSFPAMLYLASKRLAIAKNFPFKTYYSSYGSSSCAAWALFIFGVAMVIYVLTSLFVGVER